MSVRPTARWSSERRIAFHFTSFSSFLSAIELELIQQTQRERTNSAQRAILAQATGGGQRLLASSESGPGSPKNQDWRGYLHVWCLFDLLRIRSYRKKRHSDILQNKVFIRLQGKTSKSVQDRAPSQPPDPRTAKFQTERSKQAAGDENSFLMVKPTRHSLTPFLAGGGPSLPKSVCWFHDSERAEY